MFKKKKYQSKLLKTAHDMATSLYKVNAITTTTMREFDALCLTPVKKLSNNAIKKIRLDTGVSQAVFAAYLNTSISTVRQWEQGSKRPHGPSLKLLCLVEKKGLSFLAKQD